MPEPTPVDARLALATNAVGAAANASGAWLEPSACQAIADAVLAAIEPAAEHCVHDAAIHHRHHQPRNPVIGCPWCEGGTRVEGVETGGLT